MEVTGHEYDMQRYDEVAGGEGYKVVGFHIAKSSRPREELSLFEFEELMIKRLGLRESEGREK